MASAFMIAPRPGSLLSRVPAGLALLAAAAFAALSLSTDAATRFYQWPWYFYWQVLLIAPIATLAGRLVAARRALPRFGGWLDAGLGLLVLANLAAALLSPFRPQSLNAVLVPLAAVSLAYLGLDWIERAGAGRTARVGRLARFLGVLMGLFVATSLVDWLGGSVGPAWKSGWTLGAALAIRNAQPLGHSVYTTGFLVLAAPWLAGLGLAARGWRRGGWLLAAALALALVPTTSSRGGALAAVVELAAAAGLWFAALPLSRARRGLIVVGALLAAGLLVGADPRLRGFVVRGRWSDDASESNRQRSAMLAAGWLMGCDRPWTGFGPGTVALVYPRYRAQLPGGVEDVLQLHSTPAQIWAELGLPGALGALLVVVGLAGLARDSWKRRTGSAAPRLERLAPLAVTISAAGYAVVCLIDYQLDVPVFAAVAAALLVLWRASLSAGGEPARSPVIPPRLTRLLGGLLFVLLATALVSAPAELRARQAFAGAVEARDSGRDDAFVAGAERAAALAPWDTFYLTQLAAFYGEQQLHAEDAAVRARARASCIALLRRALAVDPDQEYCHFNLGWLLGAEDPAAAERHFRAAARLAPDRGGIYLGIGFCRLARGDRPAAVDAFALEWLNNPAALASPVWDDPTQAALRGDVRAALHRLSRRWLQSAGLPAPVQDQVGYVAALADWWTGASADTAVLIRRGRPDQRRFFANLPAVEARTYVPASPPQPWERLYAAWREGADSAGLDTEPPATAAAIRRRFARTDTGFARLLTAPAGADHALVQLIRNQRPGYSVLQRNQDGYLLSDLYIFPENVLVAGYASFLFPPKGYLPSQLLLHSLADLPPAAP